MSDIERLVLDLCKEYYCGYMEQHGLVKVLHDTPKMEMIYCLRLMGLGFIKEKTTLLDGPMGKYITIWKLKDGTKL